MGRKFLGNWFVALQYSTVHCFVIHHGDVNSWVTGLLHYNVRQFITLLYVHGDVNSWGKVTHEIHKQRSPMNYDDSTGSAQGCVLPIIPG